METSGMLPAQIAVVLMYLIPKVPVGVRPIGVFCAPYRVWAKARRPIANEWEKRNARPYCCGKLHGCRRRRLAPAAPPGR
eukprot:3829413-Pyramimonas_sp.AAC.1